MRIAIVGNAGGGKSTLAKRLAAERQGPAAVVLDPWIDRPLGRTWEAVRVLLDPMMTAIDTASTRATERLRSLIVDGSLRPGTFLRQDELAARLGVSRTPLRHALKSLAVERLVIYDDFRGARVAPMSAGDVADLFDMRIALEPLCLAGAIPRLTADALAEATAALGDDVNEGGGGLAESVANWRFHEALYRPAERPELLRTVEWLNRRADRAEIIAFSVRERVDASRFEHRALLDACAAGDRRGASGLLRRHLRAARDATLDALSRVESTDAHETDA